MPSVPRAVWQLAYQRYLLLPESSGLENAVRVSRIFARRFICVLPLFFLGCGGAPEEAKIDEVALREFPPKVRSAWNEQHVAMQMHSAPDPVSRSWLWRAVALMPDSMVASGGRLDLLVTQPVWAVMDANGDVFVNADGLEVQVAIPSRDGYWEPIASLAINLHRNSEERRWIPLRADVPAGTRLIGLQVLPGPRLVGNHDFDHVWVSVEPPLDFKNALSPEGQALVTREAR